jgi:hypothetical protein
MQLDYSDLYNIMAFFAGTPDERFKGRDDLAQKIANQGRKFRLEHWRWEDMQAYVCGYDRLHEAHSCWSRRS